MAKIPFSKLDAKVCNTVCSAVYCNAKGEEIQYEIKQYLPIEEKIEMITKIINQSLDNNDYFNPLRIKIFTVLEVVYAYTNLSFSAKQKENIFKLYDLLVSTNIFKTVKDVISDQEWNEVEESIITVIDNIYKYKNSAMGIMEMLTSDYSNLQLDAQSIQQTLADPNNMSLLKDILTKLG